MLGTSSLNCAGVNICLPPQAHDLLSTILSPRILQQPSVFTSLTKTLLVVTPKVNDTKKLFIVSRIFSM